MKTVLSSLEGDVGHKDLEYAAEATKRKDRYEERVGKGGVTYISTGDPILDAQWYGYQKTDLITLAGKSGVGKSWLMCYLAILCDNTLPEEMGPLLFVTNEMTEDEIADRMDCIKFKLAYERFLSGELNRLEYRRYCKGLENLEASKNKMVILYNINTIDDLHQKMLLYRPAIVFLDGSYLMEPDKEEDWKKIVFITRHLKGLAKTTGTPIVNSTQLKRGAKNSRSKMSFDAQEDFAWGSSFVMDSDIAMRGYQDAKMQYLGEVGWEYAKGRRIKPGTELILQSDLETMEFQFKNKSEGKKFEEDDEEVVF